jgi:hypothetical protein
MSPKIYKIQADWDAEADVRVATSDDAPGLATEASTLERLTRKLRKMIPELLLANKALPSEAAGTVRFELTCDRQELAGIDRRF